MEIKVFISIGSNASSEQREFIDGVLDLLKTVGLSPRIMNENEWSHEQPLLAIKKVIKECCGIIVIAFTRTKFERGVEIKKESIKDLIDVSLPTPWNHIEGAMAYTIDLPLLVIAENGLKEEGLIDKGYDWNVYWTNLNLEGSKSEKLRGFLQSWKKAVENYHIKRHKEIENPDIENLTLGQLIKSMKVSQIWTILVAIFSVLSGLTIAAYKFGGGKWPWE